MFKDYFYEINEDDINLALPDKPINQYILKHIYHITLDVQFDFDQITDSVNELLHSIGEKQIPQQECEQIWAKFHIQRYFGKHQLYREQKIQKPVKKQVKFLDDIPKQPFNVLKDSVRLGNTDKEMRQKEKQQMEQKLFESLDQIKLTKNNDAFKPLKYLVKFDEEGNYQLENQELRDEDVEKLKIKENELESNIKPNKRFQNSSSDDSDDSDDDSEEDYLQQQRMLIKK